jgi:hypothetical protein
MEWTLRLVGAGMDGQPRSCDVMVISRPDGLGEIADLGITLAEAKQLLVQVQRQGHRQVSGLSGRARSRSRTG